MSIVVAVPRARDRHRQADPRHGRRRFRRRASLISRWIDAEPDMMVAASLRTGLEAVDQDRARDPDVVVLDIEMPELDGISALPLLLARRSAT
jgi:chemotaxis response regulator CheB